MVANGIDLVGYSDAIKLISTGFILLAAVDGSTTVAPAPAGCRRTLSKRARRNSNATIQTRLTD